VSIGGFAPSFSEVNDQTRSDLTKAELIAFPVLAILLLLVFRGVVAAAIPLLIGVVSILGTFLVQEVQRRSMTGGPGRGSHLARDTFVLTTGKLAEGPTTGPAGPARRGPGGRSRGPRAR